MSDASDFKNSVSDNGDWNRDPECPSVQACPRVHAFPSPSSEARIRKHRIYGVRLEDDVEVEAVKSAPLPGLAPNT